MHVKTGMIALAAVVLLSAASWAAVDLAGVGCPISGKPAVEGTGVAHNGGDVYFCCNNCPKAFEKDPGKFAAKANAQLVATKQATQVGCPVSGRNIDATTAIKVADLEIAFCCNNCKGKAEAVEGADQLEFVLGDAAFKKGFKIASKEDE